MSKDKEKAKKIKPEVLKGFKDYPPSEEIARQKLISVFREVFESFGFSPLQTPALEKIETLKGADYGSENLETIFSFPGPDDVDMALRFELTASLARYVAGNPELPLPFRRYQVGPVWRVDKPGPGRFREFTQFDIDSVGTGSMLADAEIMAAICQSFEKLGLTNYRIRYSNRKIINGLAKKIGISDEQAPDVFRTMDKLEKQGLEAVKKELGAGRLDQSGDKIVGLNLPQKQIDAITEFLTISSGSEADALAAAGDVLGDVSVAAEGIDELRQITAYLLQFGVPSNKAQIDLTVVRGLGYYTGPVFETVLDDIPEIGSVFAGGRYDGLVERFLGRKIPAVGASAGIDRLLSVLMARGTIATQNTVSQVLVTVMDPDKMPEYIKLLNEIRENSIRAEIFLGETKNLTKQLRYADRVGIPAAVILGSDEFEKGEVTIKNLTAGRVQALEVTDREKWLEAENIQETIPCRNLIEYLKKFFSQS